MAAGIFRISEILPSGLVGTEFNWTSSERPPDITSEEFVLEPTSGGARATPQGSWNQPFEMRSVRSEYSGNPVPTEQVQGVSSKPQEFRGVWNDRYNFKGYAQGTMLIFAALAKRGNLVEITFQGKGYRGLIKTWNFSEQTDWKVHYNFALSIHGTIQEAQTAGVFSQFLEENISKSPLAYRDETADIVEAMVLADETAPRSALVDGPADAVSAANAQVELSLDALDDALDQRDLNVSAPNNPISPFATVAAKYRALVDGALSINQALLEVKSEVHLAVVNAQNVLDFEDWSRSMRFQSRVLLGQSLDAEAAMTNRDSPKVERLYRAHEGESLMAISRQVYGTPHQWQTIYAANGLTSEVLEEPNVLIIPSLGTA